MPTHHAIVADRLDGIQFQLDSDATLSAMHWERAYENLTDLTESGTLSEEQASRAKLLKRDVIKRLGAAWGDDHRAAQFAEHCLNRTRRSHENKKEIIMPQHPMPST